MKIIMLVLFLQSCFCITTAQTRKSVKRPSKFYQTTIAYQNKYKKTNEVVSKEDKKYFRFFSPSSKYNITAIFTKINDTATVTIKTSGKKIPEKYFTRYGKLTFAIDSVNYQLTVFQSKDLSTNDAYKDYLFLPFSDITSGRQTYGTGRYIDLLTTDITNQKCFIDFNKAYNPYCAYSNEYNCPIPPKENRLPIAINAGEKSFAKTIKH